MGSEFWGGLKDWTKNIMLGEGKISPEDLNLMPIVDEPEEVMAIIKDFYEKKAGKLEPNYKL